MVSTRFHARSAGLSLIIMAVLAGFAYGYAFNLLNQGLAFHQATYAWICFIGFVLIVFLDLNVARSLCSAFPDRGLLVKLISGTRLLYAGWLAFALVPLSRILYHSNAIWLNKTTVQLYLNDFSSIWSHSLVLFGIHLLLFGYFFLRQADLPHWLGVLLLIGGVSYLVHHGLAWCWLGYAAYNSSIESFIALPCALGELMLAVWLLFAPKKVFSSSVSKVASEGDSMIQQ